MRRLILLAPLLVAACDRAPEPAAPPAAETLATPTAAAPQTGVAAAPEIIPVDQVRKSQEAAVTQRIANTDITVTYSRPVARGRELFGKLVPYDAVWNPGADKATSIEVTRDVQVHGQALPAGRYSMWAIPGADNWTLMFSRMADTFHATYPGEAQDALRLDVKPEQGPHMEVLSFYFPLVEGKEATLRLHWGTTMVPLVIRVP
jgi:hypothetical protein